MDLYPALKPLKVEKPKADKQRAQVIPGAMTQATYERKQFQQLFKKESKAT